MQEYIRELTLSQMLKALKINTKILIVFMLGISLVVIGFSWLINSYHERVYDTTGAIQINNYAPERYIDQQITMSDNKSNDIPNSALATRSEVEEALIKSGYILMPVIRKNHLDIKLTPIGVPIIGRLLQSACKSADENTNIMFGYCHGRIGLIDVSRFDVPDKDINKKFILKVITPTSYEIYLKQQLIISGVVGTLSSQNGITILVNKINPKPGTNFLLSKLSMDNAVGDLSQHIMIEPVIVGKNFVPPITGILKISMSGDNPKLQALIINDIIDQLKQTALEQQGVILQSSISFIDKQLDNVSEQLKMNQSSMVSFQSSNNVISLDSQERQYIQRLSDVEQSILENKIAINQFSTLYASKHPIMIDLYTQRDYLNSKKAKLDDQLKKIPKDEAIYLNLKRNLDVYQQLYSYLLNKQQELKMKQSSLSSPVEILYYASPNVTPKVTEISVQLIAVSLVIIFTIIIIVFLNMVFFGNTDPWLMSELSKIPLLAVLPYSKTRHRSLELTAGYLLNHTKNGPLVINIGNISSGSGKTYVINSLIRHLKQLNKTCLHIHLGTNEHYLPVAKIINMIEKQPANNNFTNLEIDQLSAMDKEQMQKLIAKLTGFEFIFIESPSTESSSLFLHLTEIANESLLIVSPKDTRNTLEWLVNDIINLGASITQIIYNNPKKTLIKSLYSVESYSQ